MTFIADQKIKIVLEGLAQKNSITEVCEKYSISRQTFYDWKNQMIEGALNNWKTKQVGRNSKDDVASLSEAKDKIKELKQNQEELKKELKQANKERAIQKLKREFMQFQLTQDDIDPEVKAKNIEILKKTDFPLDANDGS